MALWYDPAPLIRWWGHAVCSSLRQGFQSYPIQGTDRQGSGLNSLSPFLSNISYYRRSKLLYEHLSSEKSDRVEGHCLSPGHEDEEAVSKRG